MRLVIVSNRLPVRLVETDGRIAVEPSAGGLATGLEAYLNALPAESPFDEKPLWVGWPGRPLTGLAGLDLFEGHDGAFDMHPVHVPSDEMDAFYHGFCNAVLWPLFHYFPTYVSYREASWRAYEKVNARFLEAISPLLREGDVIWVHDYQLMLLPQLLRQAHPLAAIGFFLHIPFPSHELFRTLPRTCRQALLHGVLGSDLVGFHTYDYTRHFVSSVSSILGLPNNMGRLAVEDRPVVADTFPMGIDVAKYAGAAASAPARALADDLRRSLAGADIILSMDRLDYSKGILNRLAAFDRFLKRHPERLEKVVLMLVVVPSRIEIKKYQEMKKRIDEMVGRINGKYATMAWTPILYRFSSFPLGELAALYAASDVALVTPLRDGMNLIAKEYVAAKNGGTGVLILSETAGAAAEMGETITVNPRDISEMAEAIETSLTMDRAAQIRINQTLFARLTRFDVRHWAGDFLDSLFGVRDERRRLESHCLSPLGAQQMVEAARQAKRRLLLLEAEGLFVSRDAAPDAPAAESLELLTLLGRDPANMVVIIGSGSRADMERLFGTLPVALAAENGAFLREAGQDWIMPRPLPREWIATILPLMQRFAGRLPGATVEEREHSLVWRYRRADKSLGEMRARELCATLMGLAAGLEVTVRQGPAFVETVSPGVGRGAAAYHFQRLHAPDAILALAATDDGEEIFTALPEQGPFTATLRVGLCATRAAFNLRNARSALVLLRNLAG
ncbi:bifunctional alpha,alpha-trehalose-phosphate synthase (UDP-forming)/trehalose-phosphatase [Desulfolutivibrio sp.]|uniref:bifunctional alpha,alpha-trehalose-phosphate synthase (UDP-forming)/trehalose-phosphatase n=1 Tax=Desulfolutivibrio sp. TaxID=2773296 RepID=UPI002F962860